MNNDEKWDLRFLNIAKEISTWSKDPSTTIGAVLVKDRRILSTGYNGFPSKIADNYRLEDRTTKYTHIIHAEMNALLTALKHGISTYGSTLYIYGLPCCASCTKHIIQSGVTEVVFRITSDRQEWKDEYTNISLPMLEEAGITVVAYVGE